LCIKYFLSQDIDLFLLYLSFPSLDRRVTIIDAYGTMIARFIGNLYVSSRREVPI